jgi:hypothetical protein
MMSSFRRWLARTLPLWRPGLGVFHDPFFADPNVVEDDYRRLNGRRQPSFAPRLMVEFDDAECVGPEMARAAHRRQRTTAHAGRAAGRWQAAPPG